MASLPKIWRGITEHAPFMTDISAAAPWCCQATEVPHWPCHEDVTGILGSMMPARLQLRFSPSASLFNTFHAPDVWTMTCKKEKILFFPLFLSAGWRKLYQKQNQRFFHLLCFLVCGSQV